MPAMSRKGPLAFEKGATSYFATGSNMNYERARPHHSGKEKPEFELVIPPPVEMKEAAN
jgi:hypothetical protein